MVSNVDDVDLWYETNPSLGTVLKERTIRSEIGDDITDFNIQRLGLWIKYNQKSAISRNEWEALQVSKLPELTGQLFAGIKFGVDGQNAVLSVAVRTKDSRIFCEVVGCRPIRDGVGWLVSFLQNADVRKCVVDGKNGADYKKWEPGTVMSKSLNTNRSPKDFFFPQTEDLVNFKEHCRLFENNAKVLEDNPFAKKILK